MKTAKKHHIQQHDQSDCGVACLLSLIRYYGGENSLENLRELSGTSTQGTTLLGLYQAALKLGFEAQGLESNLENLKDFDAPVILHVLIDERLSHYVVCYGYQEGEYLISDPAKGVSQYSEAALAKIWRSKTLLKLQPTENFTQTESIRKKKWQWMKHLVKEDLNILVLILVLSLVTSAIGMALAIFSQKLIDDILPSENMEKLVLGIVFLFLLLLIKSGLSYVAGLFGITQSKDFNNRIINLFYGSLLYLPKRFFDTRKIGELTARMEDTSRIQSVIQMLFVELSSQIILFLVSTGFLFYYSPWLALAALASIPVFLSIAYKYHHSVVDSQKGVMEANAKKSSYYINSMQSINTIKTNTQEASFQQLNQLIYGDFQQKIFKLGKLGISLELTTGISSVALNVGFILFASLFVINKWGLSIGELMAVLSISGMVFSSVSALAFANIRLQGARVAFDRMFEFTNIEPEYQAEKEIKTLEFQSLSIQQLSFRFIGRKKLLDQINLEVKQGELIAVLGESGGGKTTLLNLIQKFYQPEEGEILFNGKQLEQYSTQDWRANTGFVTQEPDIYNCSLIENICLGKQAEDYDDFMNFCQETGFHQYIEQIPQAYACMLGEEGVNISGGQKQLVSLLRQIYRKPKLLLLDEPTSAMDKRMENFVLNYLHQIKHQCAIILVTHQIKIARKAHRIYLLENGKISDQGTHESLLKRDNLYSMEYAMLK